MEPGSSVKPASMRGLYNRDMRRLHFLPEGASGRLSLSQWCRFCCEGKSTSEDPRIPSWQKKDWWLSRLSHKFLDPTDGAQIQYRLDGNLFNIQHLQATTKTSAQHILERQYADDSPCPLSRIPTACLQIPTNFGCFHILLHWSTSRKRR